VCKSSLCVSCDWSVKKHKVGDVTAKAYCGWYGSYLDDVAPSVDAVNYCQHYYSGGLLDDLGIGEEQTDG
jgi:hypothetical protein